MLAIRTLYEGFIVYSALIEFRINVITSLLFMDTNLKILDNLFISILNKLILIIYAAINYVPHRRRRFDNNNVDATYRWNEKYLFDSIAGLTIILSGNSLLLNRTSFIFYFFKYYYNYPSDYVWNLQKIIYSH